MIWVKLLAGLVWLLVLAACAIYMIGRSLPAEHVAVRSYDIDADVQDVAARVRSVQYQPRWRGKITRIEVLSHAADAVRYVEHTGGEAIAYQLERLGERKFESRITSTDLPFGGRWLISLEPIDQRSTRVSIREEGVVHSAVYRAASRYLFGHTATMDAYLSDLERSFRRTKHGT